MALIALPIALAVALALTPGAMLIARRTGIVDRPGPFKPQTEPIPYLGGAAVLVAVAVVLAVVHAALLLPLALATLLGIADDARDLPAPARLAGEIAIGVVVAAVAPVRWSPFGPFAVVVAVVVLVNAVNMLDGLDALAASVALVGAAGFAVLLHHDDRTFAIALAGALLGFLWFNRPPARVYLGDAGAYLLGTSLALLFALSWHPHRAISAGVASIALVALPVMETIVTVLRRRRARRPLFVGDRGHVYDQLVDRGWPAPRASLAFAILEAALAAVAVAVTHAPAALATVVVAVAVLLPLLGAIAIGFTRPGVEEPS